MPMYSPDAISLPSSTYASCSGARSEPSGVVMTCAIGSACFLAKSKSRSSCAGTPITAPVPYSAST